MPALRPIGLAVCLLGAAPASFGLPTGAVQTSGQTTLTTPQPGQLDILQSTPRASLDWTNFSIGAGERVRVLQPDRTSVLLNRVVGDNPSLIYGSLQSNGSVWLINPRGIVFGVNSRVDVGGLVASTLSIGNDALASGRIQLGAGAGGGGELRSEGHISAVDGTVALVAPKLLHSGQITARRVGLVAASDVLVDVEGDGLVFFNVRNDRLDTRLALLGGVRADGGSVEVRAAARAGFADTVLNMDGVVQARGLGKRAGRIVVDAGEGGGARIAGTLDVSSTQGQGGSAQVLGDRVNLDANARIDASGAEGGGSILVGGDYQGANAAVRNATQTQVAHGAALDASATARGDGGRIVVWADDTTVFDGHASVRGGAQGGHGGFVETSGKRQLGVQRGVVDVSAPAGQGGQWLLDPANIIVATGGGAAIGDVDTAGVLPGTTQTVAPATLVAVGGSVTLAATSTITVNNDVALTTSNANLTLTAGSRIDLNASLSTNNGAITLNTGSAGLGQLTGTTVNAGNDTIAINGGGGNVTLAGTLQTTNTGNSAIRITNTADLQIGNLATGGAAGDITLSFTGTGTQAASTGITAGNLIKQNTGTLVLSSATNSFTGGTQVTGGVLGISGATATAGTGDIDIGANTLDLSNAASLGNTVIIANGARITSSAGGGTLATGAALTIGNGQTLTLSGVGGTLSIAREIDDSNNNGQVTVNGGTVALQTANTFNGDTTVSAGVLRLDGATANAGLGDVILGNRTLDITNGANFTRVVTFTNGATFTSSTGNGTIGGGGGLTIPNGVGINLAGGASSTLTISRAVSDGSNNDGRITVTGGTVVLTQNNSYQGGSTINGGTLRIDGATADLGNGAITLTAGTLDITGTASVANAVTAASNTTISSSTGGGTLGAAGALTLADGATLNLAGGAASTLVVDRAISQVAGGPTESVSITAGTVNLKKDSTYAGSTTLAANTTLVAGDGATAGSVGSGNITLGNGATLRIDRNDPVTLAQDILGASAGDGTLSKVNSNTLILTGTNTYGATSITAGTLQVGNNAGTGSLGSGAIALAAPGELTIRRTGTLVIPGVITGDGSFTQAGTGTTSLSGNSAATFTGAVNVTGGTLQIDGASASVGSGTIALAGNALDITNGASVGNTVTLANGARISSSTGGGTLAAGTALSLGNTEGLTLAGGASSMLTVARAITDTNDNATVAINTGTVRLQATNSYGGDTTVTAGVLRIDGATANAGDGGILLGANTLDITGGASVAAAVTAASNATLSSSTGGGTLGAAGALTLADGATLNLAGGAASTLIVDRAIAQVAGGPTEAVNITAGTVVLKGANSYAGGTSLAAGTTLQLDASTAGSGSIAIGTGTLDLVNGSSVANDLSVGNGGRITSTAGNGNVAAGTALSLGNGFSLELAGGAASTLTVARAITDTNANAALNISAGTVVLTANNSYGGSTAIAASSTLAVGNGGATGSLGSGSVSIGSASVLQINRDNSSAVTLAAPISGAGSLQLLGAATVELSADNGYTGGTTVANGALRINGVSADAGSGTIALGANTLDIAGSASVSNTLTAGSGASITSSSGGGTLAAGTALNLGNAASLTLGSGGGGTLTIARSITDTSNNASVTMSGGTVVLQAANSYDGGTTVNGGLLRISGATATAGTGTLALGANTLDIMGGASVAAPLTVSNGATLTSSSGGGTLAASSDLSLGNATSITLSSAGGGTLAIGRAIVDTAANGAVVIGGGTVALQAANTYRGGTTVSTGTLRVEGATAAAGAATGGITLGANTLDIAGGANVTNPLTVASGASIVNSAGTGTLGGSNTLTLPDAATLNLSSAGTSLTVSRDIADANNNATVAVLFGNVLLLGNNSFGGDINVTSGTLRVNGAGATLGDGTIHIGNNTLDISGGASLANVVTITNGGTITSSSGGGTLAANATPLTLPGGATVNFSSGGGGTLNLSRVITDGAGTSNLNVSAGSVVLGANNSVDGNTAIGASTTLAVGTGGSAGTLPAGNVSIGNAGVLLINRDNLSTVTLSTPITGAGSLQLAGGATLVLSADNGYTGGTTVTNGVLRISGATADAGSGTIALGANTLDISNGASVANTLTASSGGAITSGSGNGTLAAGTALNLGNAASLTLDSGTGSTLTIQRAITDTANNATVTMAKGTVVLQAANSYDGGTSITSGTLRISGAAATAGSGPMAFSPNTTLDIAGGASVANVLTLAGNASLTNSSGAGTLATNATPLTLATGSTLGVNSSGSGLAIDRVIDDGLGVAGLAHGGGLVTLSAANTFDGGVSVANAATLRLGHSAAAGTGAIALQGASSVLDLTNGASVTNALSVAASGATISNSSGSATLGGTALVLGDGFSLNLSSAGTGLTVARVIDDGAGTASINTGGGTVTLGGANTYSGSTTVSSGTLRVAGASASAGTGTVALGANTLDITGGASMANTVTLADGATVRSSSGGGTLAAGTALTLANNAGLTLAGAAGSTLTVARSIGDLAGNARLTASGGTVVLAADNSYGGSTTIAAGTTLAAGTGGAAGTLGTGTVANAGVLRINRDGTTNINLAAAINGSGSLEQVGTGTTVLLADNAYGNTLVSAGVLQVGNGAGTGTLGTGSITVDNPGALRFNRAGTLVVPGSVSGTGRLEVAGTGIAELTANASYSGGTNVLAGTLRINGAAAGAGSGAITLAAGTTLDIAGGASVANVLNVGNGSTVANSSGSGTLAFNATPVALAGGSTFNLSSSGTGLAVNRSLNDGLGVASVNVSGTGSVSLGAVQAYDGTTRVNAGSTLVLGVDNALAGTSALVVDGGTLSMGTRNLAVASAQLLDGAITGSGGVLTSASSFDLRQGSVSAVLAGGATVGLNKTGAGTLTLSGGNTYGGPTSVSAGTLALGASHALPDGSAVTLSNATLDLGARIDTVASFVVNAGTLAGTGTLTAATTTVAGGTLGANLGTGTLATSGSVALNGTSAATSVSVNGGTLTLGSADRLADSATVDVASGATLALGGNDSVGALNLRGTISGAGTLTAATYALNNGSTAAGADLGTGALTSAGSSVLAGRSAAATVGVNSGTLTLGSADRLADGAAVTVASGATLSLGGNDTVASLGLTGTLAGNGTLTAGSYTLNTGASTAALAHLGTGTLTVLGNSSLGGTAGAATVNVNAGSLTLGSADRLADTAAVSVASGASLVLNGNDTIGTLSLTGTLGGIGTLTAGTSTLNAGAVTLVGADLGTGTLQVAGNAALGGSSAAGIVNVNAGTLSLGSADRLADAADVTVATGATLAMAGNDSIARLTLSGTLSGTGSTLTTSDRSTLQTGASVVANLGAGRMDVAGNATLAGTSAAGTVNVNGGTLTLATAGRLAGTANVTVSGSASLALGGAESVQSLDLTGTLNGAAHKLTASQYTLRAGALVNAKLGLGRLDSEGNATLSGTVDAQTVNVNAGTLTLTAGDLLSDIADVTVATPATLTLNGSDTVGSLALSGTLNGTGTLNAGTYVLTEGTYNLDLGPGNLTSRGNSQLNGTSGAAVVNVQTGTLTLGSAGRFTQAPAVTVSSGAILALGGNELFGTLAGAGTVNLGAATLSTGGGGDSSFSGSLTGTGGLTKLGATTFTLGGSNTYTGSTRVEAGTLRLAGSLASANVQVLAGSLVLEAANRLADTANVDIAAGTSLTLTGNDSIGSLALAGTLDGSGTLTAGTYTLTNGQVIADLGTGALTTTGASRLQGTSAATSVSVNGGTLTLPSANRLSSAAVTTVASGALLDITGDQVLGSLAGAGNVALGSFTLTTGAAGDSRFDGVLSGTGGVVKQGTGRFILGGANSYGGSTRVAAGNLETAGSNVMPDASSLVVDSGATFTVGGLDTVATLSLSGTLAGSGTLTAATYALSGGTASANLGAGTFTASGNSNLAGRSAAASVAVTAGTLTLASADRLADTAQVTVAAGATLRLNGNDTVARLDIAGTLDGSGTLTAANLALDGARIDANLAGGALTSVGASSLQGSASVATLQVAGGTLALGSAQRLLAAPALTVDSGATLQLGGNETLGTLAGAGTVNLGAATLSTGSGGDSSLAGVISGSGGLVKQGASTFTLAGNQAYTGATAIDGGTLVAAGTLASAALQVNAGTLALAGAERLADTATASVATGATLNLAGDETVASLSLSGTLGGTGRLNAASYALAGGTAQANLGGGALTASGASTLNGTSGARTVTVTGGTLLLGSDDRLTALPAVDVRTGATLRMAGSQTAGTLTGAGTVDLAAHTLRSGSAGDSTFAGTLAGTGNLVKQGTSTFTLSGANSYSGATRVEAGTLALAAADRLGDATAVDVASGATLNLAGNDTVGSLALAGNLSGNATLTAASYALSSGNVDAALGVGQLTSTGTSRLAGTAAAGTVTVNSGSLTLAAADRLADSAAVSVATGASLVLNGNDTVGTLALSGTLGGNGRLTAGSYALAGATVNTDLGAGNLTSTGASQLNALSAAGTVAVNGGTLTLGGADRFTATPAVTVALGANLALGGPLSAGSIAGNGGIDLGSFTLATGTLPGGSFDGVITGTGGLTKLGTGSFTLGGANTYTGTTLLRDGALAVTGRLASATVDVTGGTLDLTGANRLAPGAAVIVRNGSTLSITGDQAVASLALTGTLTGTGTWQAGSVTLDNGNLAAGARLAAGSMRTTGSSALDGSFTAGSLAVDSGTLSFGAAPVGAGPRDTNGAAVTVATGATLRLNGRVGVGSLALSGTLAGTGPMATTSGVSLDNATVDAELLAGGGLRSTGNSTLNAQVSGDITVAGGQLLLGSANRVPIGSVTVDSGATLLFGGAQAFDRLAGAGNVNLNGFTLATGRGGDSVFSGVLSGSSGIVKQGSGSFTLAGANSYTGDTRVEAGTLNVSGSLQSAQVRVDGGTLALTAAERIVDSATVAVASGATLTLAGNETVASLALAGTLNGSGTLTGATYAVNGGTVVADLGTGTFTSTGNSTLAGTSAATLLRVDGGTLTLAAAHRLADAATVNVDSGATLSLGAADTVANLNLAGTLAGTGTLTAANYLLTGGRVDANLGAGALTSRGSSTLAGQAAVSSLSVETGTLALASAQRLSALPAVQVSNAATLAMTGDQAFGTLSGSGNVALASFTLGVGSGGDSIFDGVIGGTGGLIKQGSSSTFTLTGSNSYTGLTTVEAGTLRVGDGGSTGSLASSSYQLLGMLRMQRSDEVTLAAPVAGTGGIEQAGTGRLVFSGNNKTYSGDTTITRGQLATASAEELPNGSLAVVRSGGHLALGGTETLRGVDADGTVALAGNLLASGDLLLRGALTAPNATLLSGQRIDAPNVGNRFGASVALDARGSITLNSGVDNGGARALLLGAVNAAAGGRIDAGQTTLGADANVTGGTLELVSAAPRVALAPDAEVTGKQATALPIAFAEDAVLQGSAGRISVAAGAGLSITTTQGGSVQLLRPDNTVQGSLSVVTGVANTEWLPNATSLVFNNAPATNFAVQSRVRVAGTSLTVGGAGIMADVVAIRADRLATSGAAEIVARLPFDSAAGSVTSLPGLTLELTPEAYNLSFPFGAAGADAGLRVNVGGRNYGNRTLPLDAGFVTVLPRNGARGTTAVLLTGPVVNPAGGYRFFSDSAGSQAQIPVFYNGVLPTTPQVENSISATVSVSEGARKERFDEAVRTENVAVRLRAGVIAEVGPASSATTGTEGLRMPAGCTPATGKLLCAATP